MALVFKKIAEYDWQVTVETPDKGKFKQETFTAKFKNIGRKAFAKLVEEQEYHLFQPAHVDMEMERG